MSGSWKRNDWNGNRGSGLIMLTETFRNLVSYASSPSPVINPTFHRRITLRKECHVPFYLRSFLATVRERDRAARAYTSYLPVSDGSRRRPHELGTKGSGNENPLIEAVGP